MSSRVLHTFGRSALYLLLPLLVLGWSSVGVTAPYTLHVGLLVFIGAIALAFVPGQTLQHVKTAIHSLAILLLVGGTGWFLSPFFFLLYLLPIYLGFLYTPAVAFSFLAALLVIFGSSIGEVDVAFDIMTLLSLLLVIPLVMYLRRRYLILRQSDKDILILNEEGRIKDADTIARLLSNRVTNLGVNVRQPLTFVKQASEMLADGKLDEKEREEYINRIRVTATETLDMIRRFEGETSANRVLKNNEEETVLRPEYAEVKKV